MKASPHLANTVFPVASGNISDEKISMEQLPRYVEGRVTA
jgi:hypothetical protein